MSIMLNGGPDAKHRFLQHIQLGSGTMMNPVVQGSGEEVATGARITLTFKERVPQMTGKQVEALLAPLISFEVKTPIQAFTDTLPPKLKAAIMDHSVLVGMSTDMVLFAKWTAAKQDSRDGRADAVRGVGLRQAAQRRGIRTDQRESCDPRGSGEDREGSGDFHQGRSGRHDADGRNSTGGQR